MKATNRSNTFDLQPSRLHQAIQGILLASVLTVSVAAHAESTNNKGSVKHSYHISGGTLGQALRQFATNSGLLFSAEAKLTDGKTSAGLDGEYTVEEGFRKLLAGSGLTYTLTGNNSVAIKVADSEKDAAMTLPEVKVTGKAVYDSNDPYNKNYAVTNSSTATKTDTPIMETPVSTQVVSQQVLKDQQAWRVEDAVKNVSGVQQVWSSGGEYQDFVIRGFGTNYTRFRNGVRLTTGTFDMANVQQVEVLKGPAAMLYGRVEPGGMVNVVTKKPLGTPYYSVQQQFGSYDFYRTTVDATGPLTADKSLTYRFDLGYTSSNSFRDFVDQDRVIVSPSLRWQATPDTEFNLNMEYSNNNTTYDNGLPAVGNRVANVPISRNYSQPGFNKDNLQSTLIDFNWSHSFNKDWKVTNGIVANWANNEFREVPVAYFQPLLNDTPNPQVRRGVYFENESRNEYTTYINLNGKFDTFGIKHNVLLGGDRYNLNAQTSGFFGLNNAILGGFSPESLKYFTFVDLKSPNYSQFPYTVSQLDSLRQNAPNDFFKSNQSWYGLYFQDQLSFFDDKLHILGGGRYDWARQEQGSSFTSYNITEAAQDVGHFSPRVGILYHPMNWLSVYGNYVESFGLNPGRTDGGTPLVPETAEQLEAGFKTEWFDGLLMTNLAYFHIDKNNIAARISDLNYATIGAARSQGIEFDASGQLTDALSVVATYAYTDARTTKDVPANLDGGNQGNRLPNVAENSGSTWLKYAFQNNQLRGLSIGVGAYLASKREGDLANSYQLPGYVRADTYAAYTFKLGKTRLTTQLNVNNILDQRYYFTGQPYNTSSAYNKVADPLTVLGSIKLEF